MEEKARASTTGKEGPLLFGRVLDGAGGGRAIGWEEARHWQPAGARDVLWVHLSRGYPGVYLWLVETLGIPEPTARLLTGDKTRPTALRDGDTLAAALRGINFNPDAQPEDMVSMQIWSDGRRVVTLRRLPLQTTRDTLARVDRGKGPLDAGGLIADLVGTMIARMNDSIIDMNDHIDLLESAERNGGASGMLGRISAIRRNCLALKRHMSPQHEALERMARDAPAWLEDHDRLEISETIGRLRRYLDDIDISKESALVLQDDLRARTLANTQRTQYLLTLVAGIFLPLSFVTGLLGINVGGMPGADHPDAFWIVVGLCAAIMAGQLALFLRWRWL